MRNAARPLALLLILLLSACATSTVIADVQFAIDAVSIAAPVVAAFSGPAAADVLNYLTVAGNGLQCVLTEAESPTATTASISAAIGRCLATVLPPAFPGLPPLVGAVINAVFNAIAIIINKWGPKAAAGAPVVAMKLTHGDRQRISAMKSELAAAIAKLKK